MKDIKNIVFFERKVLERRQKGFFSEVKEVEVLKNFTPKQRESFLTKINERKRVLFKEVSSYNLKTIKDKKRLLIDALNNKNTSNIIFEDIKNNILKTIF